MGLSCLWLPLLLATELWSSCPSGLYTVLERPYAFVDTPVRPLSSAFELDTHAVLTDKTYSVSLDLWRNPSVGSPRGATGIDLWSLMIGVNF